MDNQICSGSLVDLSIANIRHDPKLAGEKRASTELGGKLDLSRKRIKMRDLQSIIDPGTGMHRSDLSVRKEATYEFNLGRNEEKSEITKVPEIVRSDSLRTGSTERNTPCQANATRLSLGNAYTPTPSIDLNTKAPVTNGSISDGTAGGTDDCNKRSLYPKPNNDLGINVGTSRNTGLDLNTADGFNSVDQNPFYPFKNPDRVKNTEPSECGSSTGPLEEKDPLKVWKEMKENGFLSSTHGGIPVPKPRPKKIRDDTLKLKKKMEIAKREQVNRFTKIAAPSGLLNGLNPGIINHVRNSKQVHSIIEALVRSERRKSSTQSKPPSQLIRGDEEMNDRRNDPGASQLSHSHQSEPSYISLESRHTRENPMCLNTNVVPSSSNHKAEHDDSNISDRRVSIAATGTSNLTSQSENEKLALALSSSIRMVSENTSSVSHEDSANQASVSSLSVKAATIASQWLDLLSQDIKGRLAALRRSKKRVQAVIQTELPFLIEREFPSNQENDPHSRQSASTGCPSSATPDMHRARWTGLFDQMDKTLSEEGRHLIQYLVLSANSPAGTSGTRIYNYLLNVYQESWLSQVQEMQLRCDRGLQCVNWYGMQLLGRPEDFSRKQERELAVRAAAASIYSTCNLVTATEDVSCA